MRSGYTVHPVASTSSSNGATATSDAAFEEEEVECPLCLDPFDLSDMGFKPCPCGYQICGFCYNHIRQDLNGRCPACRQEYTESNVRHVAIDPEEAKKYERAKKRREREQNRTETNNRKALQNVRVKQKTQAHIQGMTYRFANEDTIPLLQSNEWFGQYGKILKLFLAKRTNMPDSMAAGLVPDPRNTPVNIYINFATHREASACITSCDGEMTPDGQFRLRAGWGTTKYCPAYLRGQRCRADQCMMAHEPGEEVDPVGGAPGPITREEMSTLKHAMKEQESREAQQSSRSSNAAASSARPSASNGPGLPATASWAKPNATHTTSAQPSQSTLSSSSFPLPSAQPPSLSHKHSSGPQQNATVANAVPQRAVTKGSTVTHPLPARPPSREAHAAAVASAARSKHGSISGSIASTARRASASSSSDERATTPVNHHPIPGQSLMRKSSLAESSTSASIRAESKATETAALQLDAARPGQAPVSSNASAQSVSPNPSSSVTSPFSSVFSSSSMGVGDDADFDNTLRSFAAGSFSFNMNPDIALSAKGKGKESADIGVNGLDGPSAGDFLLGDVGSSLASGLPAVSALVRSDSEQGYTGSFDPFAEVSEEEQARPKASRFGFAKKGLFGSSDSLQTLGTLGNPLDTGGPAFSRSNSFAGNGILSSGLRSASPSSAGIFGGSHALKSATPPRSHSPQQRTLISPPPGLRLHTNTDALWQASTSFPQDHPQQYAPHHNGNMFSRSPVDPDEHHHSPLIRSSGSALGGYSSANAVLPLLNSAAIQPLPLLAAANAQLASAASASLPPGFSHTARQPLPSAAAHSLPPPQHSLASPPGLGQNKEDVYSHLSAAALALPPRSMDNSPALTDPAILSLNMGGLQTRYGTQQQHFQQPGQQQHVPGLSYQQNASHQMMYNQQMPSLLNGQQQPGLLRR